MSTTHERVDGAVDAGLDWYGPDNDDFRRFVPIPAVAAWRAMTLGLR